MTKHKVPRRYFTNFEIKTIHDLATQGKSQSYVAKILNRHPSTIAQAAKRYHIKFNAPPGRPKLNIDPEILHQKKILYLRNWRRRKNHQSQLPINLFRFDDPRVMIRKP